MDKLIIKWLQESDKNTSSSLKSDSTYDIAFFGGYALAKKECANELRRHLSEASTRPDNAVATCEVCGLPIKECLRKIVKHLSGG